MNQDINGGKVMDDKLREIIESKKDDREIAEFAGITLTLAEYDFLIEQAELVQELEEENEQLKDDVNRMSNEYLHGVKQQNKRYREALEEIETLTRSPYEPSIYMLNYIARNGLERENNE